jgi:hypothetical protein
LTLVFLPDTTGLDLKEQERRWNFIRDGRGEDYHGIAIHPKHLSMWERFRGVGKNYNAELDFQQKVEEMRKDWETYQLFKAQESTKEGGLEDVDHLDHVDLFDNHQHAGSVHHFFQRTGSSKSALDFPERQEAIAEKQAIADTKNGHRE